MAKDKINIAVVGAGRIALMHAAIIRELPQAILAGVVDRQGNDARLQSAGLGGVRVYSDAEDAFADGEVDAVLIASSTPSHCALVCAAAEAGKDILCEKPVAFCAADIETLAREVEGCGRVVRVAFNRRFDSDFASLRARLQDGEVGDALLIHITNHDPKCPPPAFAKTAGGIFVDFNSHDFDMLRFLTGATIINIHARGGAKVCGDTDTDTTLISMELSNGVFASVHCCRQSSRGYDQRLEVLGKKGMLFVHNHKNHSVAVANHSGELMANPPPDFVARYRHSYINQLQNFIAECRGDDRAIKGATLNDALEAIRVAEAAEQSLTGGQAIIIG